MKKSGFLESDNSEETSQLCRLTDALIAWNDVSSLSLEIGRTVVKSQVRSCKRTLQELNGECDDNTEVNTTRNQVRRLNTNSDIHQDKEVLPQSSVTSQLDSPPLGNESAKTTRETVNSPVPAEPNQGFARLQRMIQILGHLKKAREVFRNELEQIVDDSAKSSACQETYPNVASE